MRKYLLILFICMINFYVVSAGESENIGGLLYPSSYTGGDIDKAYIDWLTSAFENSSTPAGEAALFMAGGVNNYDVSNSEKAGEILQKIISQKGAAPFVKDLAVQLYSRHLIDSGNFSAGRKLQLENGLVDNWFVCGPFGRYAYASFYRKYAPEKKALPVDHVFNGSRNKISWRKADLSAFDQLLYPYRFIYPTNNVILYSAAQLLSDADKEAYIEVNTKASCKVWLNGRPLFLKDNIKDYLPARSLIKCKIRKGVNLLFLKIYSTDENLSMRVRLLNSTFIPLKGVSPIAEITPEKFPFSLSGFIEEKRSIPVRVTDFCARLSEKDAMLLKSFFMNVEQIPDLSLFYAEQALKLAPADTACRYRYAEAASKAKHLPAEVRSNIKRRILKTITEDSENSIPALLLLAALEEDDERTPEGIKLLNKIFVHTKKCAAAFRRKTDLFLKEKWLSEAEETARDFLKYYPQNTSSAITAGRVFQSMRRNLKALENFSRARSLKQSSAALWWIEIEALTGCGKISEAEKLIADLLEKAGGNPEINYRAAEAWLKIPRPFKALTQVELACKRLPENELYWYKKGEILYKLGRTRQALRAYRKSLELKPAQHNLRRLISKLEGRNYNFWEKYGVDVKDSIQKSMSNRYIGGTVRLIDQTVMSIYPDGSRAESIHQLQKVLTRNGIAKAAEVPVIGDLLEARTIINEKTSLEPVRIPGKNTFTMPGLRENTCVEYRFFLAHKNHYDYTFHAPCWYFRSPDTNEKFVLTQYIVEMPENFPFKYVQKNFKNEPQIKKANGRKTYTWTMRDMERVANEEGMPHIREFLPFVEVGANLSWEAMAELFANYYLGRLQPTVELKDLLSRLLKGCSSEREKVDILYRYVMDNIENTSSGNKASIINARRKGSRIILMMALLRAAGIRADYVLLRPNSHLLFEPSWGLPQPDIFISRAVAVFLRDNSDIIWLDMRYRNNVPGTILEDFSNATAFAINEKGGEFFTLPGVPSRKYTEENLCSITLQSDSLNAEIKGENRIRGKSAALLKEALIDSSEKKRMQSFERRMSGQFSSFTTTELKFPDLEKSGTDFVEKYRGEISRLLTITGKNSFRFSLPLNRLEIVKDIDSNPEERKNPYRINALYASEDTVILNLSDKFQIASVPEDIFIKSDLGSYKLKFSVSDNRLTIKRKYIFEPQFIKRDKFADLIGMLRRIREVEKESIFLKLNRFN